MALSLTCACGARFELEDTLAGQEVSCPECQQVLKAPALPSLPPRTSVYALASAVLALLGAFTVLGTVAAVLVGLIALASIARNRERVTGVGFAVFGIVFGLLFTVFTLYALSTTDLFGLEAWIRNSTMTEELDYSGPLEITRPGFSITRPSEKWGVVPGSKSDDPFVAPLQRDRDLILLNVARHAYIDVRALPQGALRSLDQCQTEVLDELAVQQPNPFADEEDEPPVRGRSRRAGHVRLLSSQALPDDGDIHGRQLVAEARCGQKLWRFHIRLFQRGRGGVHVVRGYAPAQGFGRVEPELTTALETFSLH
jgi:hypothetical protein